MSTTTAATHAGRCACGTVVSRTEGFVKTWAAQTATCHTCGSDVTVRMVNHPDD